MQVPRKKIGPLYTVADTAKILALSEKTVRRRIADGVLRAIRPHGGRNRRGPVRIAEEDLEDFIRDHRSR
jgi:excisionase family DNA binding protein